MERYQPEHQECIVGVLQVIRESLQIIHHTCIKEEFSVKLARELLHLLIRSWTEKEAGEGKTACANQSGLIGARLRTRGRSPANGLHFDAPVIKECRNQVAVFQQVDKAQDHGVIADFDLLLCHRLP